MTDHLVFTSCRCSVESDSEGMQIYSYSAGMPEQIKTELQRMGSYTVSGTTLKSSLSDRSEADGYPVAFRYVPKSETNFLMTSSRYLGVDWSGTRFGGNYISHGIKTDYLPVYPIECFGESFFLNNVEYFDVSSDVRPHYLPPLDIVVSENRKITFKSIREFILDGRIQETKMLISSIIDMKSNILFSDIQDNVPKWIAVATLLLPLNMSKRVAFSTFGNLPEDVSPSLVSVYEKSNSFDIISGAKEVDPFIDAYVDWIIADTERRDTFFKSIESKVAVTDLETLKIALARYLLEVGDSDTINTFGLMNVCGSVVMSSRYDIGSLAIHTYLSYLVNCGLYDQFMKEYRMLSPCVRNKCDIDDLTKIYDQRSIAALKSITSYEQIEVNQDHYLSIISRNIDSELIDKLDSAAVAFLVYEYWKACNDERSRKLLTMLPDTTSVQLLGFLESKYGDVSDLTGANSPISEYAKSYIINKKASNVGILDDREVFMLIERLSLSDPTRAKAIFESSTKRKIFPELVKKYVGSLDYEGEVTFSDAIYYCLGLENCPYGVILELFSDRFLSADNSLVSDTLNACNNMLHPDMPRSDYIQILNAIYETYPNYVMCIEGDDRIAATKISVESRIRPDMMPARLNYHPHGEELDRYVRELLVRKSPGPEWFESLFEMMDLPRSEIMNSIHKYLSANINTRVILSEYVTYILRLSLTDDELSGPVRLVFETNQRVRENIVHILERNLGKESSAYTHFMEMLDAMSTSEQPPHVGENRDGVVSVDVNCRPGVHVRNDSSSGNTPSTRRSFDRGGVTRSNRSEADGSTQRNGDVRRQNPVHNNGHESSYNNSQNRAESNRSGSGAGFLSRLRKR